MFNLIENLLKSLNDSSDVDSVVTSLRDFFSENFKASEFSIFIFGENYKSIIPFTNELGALDCANSEEIELNDFLEQKELDYITKDNILYYKLPYKNSLLGFIKLRYSKLDNLLNFLQTAKYAIALKVQNLQLLLKMKKNTDFNELLRDIAKIIETQYDLNYIIPLIGEMVDKFVTNHLVYIFLNKNRTIQLSWPAKCNDDGIKENINTFANKNNITLTNKGKTGFFPLATENNILGCIVVKSMQEKISDTEIYQLEQIAKQSAITINRANIYSEILKHATLDALTGFYNRHQLEERIKQEAAKAQRQKTPLCAIMIDIDFFKKINDQYGHAAGDLVLKTVSRTMRSQLREYDVAGRYGGEEFAILLPFTKIDKAVMVAERLRQAVENQKIDLSKVNLEMQNKIINVTISLGIYEFKETDNYENLLTEADKALYEAKNTGRNRIVVRTDE